MNSLEHFWSLEITLLTTAKTLKQIIILCPLAILVKVKFFFCIDVKYDRSFKQSKQFHSASTPCLFE